MTLILLYNLLPSEIVSAVPISLRWRYDENFEKRFCREIDDFGWDAQWLEQCRSSFRIIRIVLVWSGLLLVAAQWWAVFGVWKWARVLKMEQRDRWHGETDVERAEHGEEKRELKIN